MKCALIIVAGGLGTRFKSRVLKPFVRLGKHPLIVHVLTVFTRCINIDCIIIVGHQDHLARFRAVARHFSKVSAVVSGGETRSESVKHGLAALKEDITHVIIHDAARPLVDDAMVQRVIKSLRRNPAVITAVKLKPTVKEVDAASMSVTKTLPRASLWEVQTPQGFKREVLEKAHAAFFRGEATDDAMLVERIGVKVKVVEGSYRNIKITTPEDLAIAEVLLNT